MLKMDPSLYKKIENLASTVKQDFKKKGVVIPQRLKDGSIQLGEYLIVKEHGVYYVKHKRGVRIEGPLNLAQTAVILANDLALGKMADSNLLNNDRWYGFKDFDETTFKHHAANALKRKDVDKADYQLGRAKIAHEQKMSYKKPIDSRFAKLSKLT